MTSSEPPVPGAEERRRLVWQLVERQVADPGLDAVVASLQKVCRAAVLALRLHGAAVYVMTVLGGDGVAACSDPGARVLAELEFDANEGPGFVAFQTQRPVLVPEIGAAVGRWPGFVSLAAGHGVRGVFAFPLQEGAVSFGVLELYAERAGLLDPEQQAMAGGFARAATDLILDGGTITAAGGLASGLSASLGDRARIHQAQGMVMVDLRVSLAEALTMMRARAFAQAVSLLVIADGVIGGTISADSWIDGDG